ncbi:MAG: YraN family protein [Chlorobi bacterium]|nr:YraN family protein [Chlorobiota bacterium]MCI0716571.1 YraN family protein [Chlorobiota bacterium]
MNLGKTGEEIAKKHFEKKGFKLVEQNFRFDRAEIDLIFKDDERKILIFAEVKTRKNKFFGEPEESVTEQKQEQILKSAEGFLIEHDEYTDYEKRFDVIAITFNGKQEKINHIENAF